MLNKEKIRFYIINFKFVRLYNMTDLFQKRLNNLGPLGAHSKEAHCYYTFPKLEGEIGTEC